MALNLQSVSSRRALTAVTLALIPLLYFSSAIIGPVLLMPGDGWSQIFGIRVLTGQMIASGMLPLWNPYIFGGMPLLASIQPGALYPPSWLFALLSPRTAMNVMVITTYHIALIGGYRFARRLELDRVSALVTGLIFTFGGFMLPHLGHTNRIAAAAWMPWILLALENLYLKATWRWVTLGAVFLMLQNLAGDPQLTFYTLLSGAPYGLFLLTLREEREHRGRFLLYSTAMVLCGAMLSAIQVIPARELTQLGDRAAINYDYFSGYSFPPYHLFGLIFPYFFGGAGTLPYSIPFWGNWNPAETSSYVGLMGLMLALVAVCGKWERPHRRIVWFWTVIAILAVTLAFGSYLPFGLHQLLYRVPVYNLFRASGRHFFEFSFAVAMLAGMGLNHLTQTAEATQRKRFKWVAVVMTMLVVITTISYRFLLNYLPASHPRSATAGLLTNPEAVVPLAMFAFGLIALFLHNRLRTSATSLLVLIVLLIDLASWGWCFEWQVYRFDVAERLQDPPAVTWLKSREADLHSFRIVSHSAEPYEVHYKELDYPNVSIVRGLQSVNGYDPVRLGRLAAMTGEMTLAGTIPDASVFGATAQGFNLLNVKYLLRDRSTTATNWSSPAASDLRFSDNPLSPMLEPGVQVELQADGAVATQLALISALGNSLDITDGTPIIRIRLHARDGRIIERELQAGRDTAEWAYDRKDSRPLMKHQRALVAESWPASGFEAHRYLARLPIERTEIDYLELDYLPATASVQIWRASLYDATTKTSMPLNSLRLSPDRWRKLESFGPIELYENLKAMPRAWFVRRLEAMPRADVLNAIKKGKLKDSGPFDPSETALIESEDFGGKPVSLPTIGDTTGAEVKLTRYEPQRIALTTHHPQPGFLVLSEIYYRGWEVWVDGKRTPIERVNYLLRGLAVPPGDHQIEFVFRAHSFRNGAAWSGAGVFLLLLGAGLTHISKSRKKPTNHHLDLEDQKC